MTNEQVDKYYDELTSQQKINIFPKLFNDIVKVLNLLDLPDTNSTKPKYIQDLIDNALIDTDGKTVICNNLTYVAEFICNHYPETKVTQFTLEQFVKPNGEKYSKGTINKVFSDLRASK